MREIELSIVVPTFAERDNVGELVQRLRTVLHDLCWELTFVDDDSPDGTSDVVREIARQDPRIRCLQRIGRRGLSSACIEGLLASSSPFLLVMDADLQHDEAIIPEMLSTLRATGADLVIASRYVQGGEVGNWHEGRAAMSRFATWLARKLCRQDIADPLSGFFLLRREVLEASARHLSAIGFKILLDMIVSSPREFVIKEIPYTFRARAAGASKLDRLVVWQFLMLLLDKSIGRYLPIRFIVFTLVGLAGVGVHLAALTPLLRLTSLPFATAQAIATVCAMTFNFALDNVLTYRDKRLYGWAWLRGLLSFYLACGVGAIANVGVASYLFRADTTWLLAALAGIAMGAVWNYAITQSFTWGEFPKH